MGPPWHPDPRPARGLRRLPPRRRCAHGVKGGGHAPDDAYEQVGETGQGGCTAHLEIRNFLGRGTPRLLIYLYPAGWTSTSDAIDGRTAAERTSRPAAHRRDAVPREWPGRPARVHRHRPRLETRSCRWRPTTGGTSVVVATDIFFVDFQLGVI
jgi:hypothetical protein